MKKVLLAILLSTTLGYAGAQKLTNRQKQMGELIAAQFQFADQQYKILAQNTPPNVMPKTYDAETDKLETSNTRWWCSGFFPGSLLYIYEYTGDTTILNEAKRRLTILEKEKHYTGNHDLGFMMYCSFGNAYRLLKDPEYRSTIDTSAASLSTRYRPKAKVIQSWNASKKWSGPVIIDNMMNLELLAWVSDHGGDKRFKEIAVNHANQTLLNHFRPDYSSYHVVDYDMETGKVIKKVTAQGAADESAWSRGQAWGLYGYTMMYRFTKDKRYLDQARHIAAFIINHPNLPKDKVPYWDFNAPTLPDTTTIRDASSAAIIASALLELGRYVNKKESGGYIAVAEQMLTSLASPRYRATLGKNGGFLLMHSTGSLPGKSEVNVPLTYADYYFLEALLRYKQWYL